MIIYTSNDKDRFEIVDKIPKDYFVWNIGTSNAPEGYVPLCEWVNKDDKDDYSIRPDTLKAIKVDDAVRKLLLDAAGYGINSKKTAEKTLAKKREPKSTIEIKARYYAETCLPIFKAISA